MMAFIMTCVRDDYFSYASECEVPQKDYRNDYKTIVNMNGNIFYRFIETMFLFIKINILNMKNYNKILEAVNRGI